MKPCEKRDHDVRKLLLDNKIAAIDELKVAAGTNSTMTVHRCLSRLGYMTSYSHCGKFYTLQSIPKFNRQGVWSHHDVKFSRDGNLLETAAALIEQSDAGFTSSELEVDLQVELKHTLLKLHRRGKVTRFKHNGALVYMSADKGKHLQQNLTRCQNDDARETEAGLNYVMPDKLRAGIILFFSLLDEKQRRLYAGMEAAKLGHGGDRKIADLLGLDAHTVSKGRLELFGGQVERGCVRRVGAGRKKVEKKLQK